MILRELFYFDKETIEPVEDDRYDPDHDKITPVSSDDTRKTRLTLKQINRVRKAAEMSAEEKRNELAFVKQMYGMAANAQEGMV